MEYAVLGFTLGLGAGIAPGPLLALVIRATLERGFRSGAAVACSPLIVDAPIIVLCLLVLGAVPDEVLAALGILGGGFVVVLGIDAWRSTGRAVEGGEAPAPRGGDLLRGALVNLLSPHPWLFWIGVGGPTLVQAADRDIVSAVAFVAVFYALLVGTKLALAGGVAGGRRRLLASRGYERALRLSALALVVAGILLAADGVAELL